MPELPEMENYKQLLTDKIQGHKITAVEIYREKSVNVSVNEFVQRVQHQTIERIERRAKHLLFYLDNGDVLLLHLMLGGLMYYGSEDDKLDRTVQIQLSFTDNQLYFIGLRLGYLHIHTQVSVEEELSDLGPDPLDINFSLDAFKKLIENKRGSLKTTLVDQQFLSGIGNRYSDEICWYARLLNTRSMDEINQQEAVQLYQSIRQVLHQAIEHGGYMDQPLYKSDQKTGGYEPFFRVYNREGEKCYRCGSTIARDEVSSKKTFYCNSCQT